MSVFIFVSHCLVGYLASFTLLNNQIAQLDCLLSFATAAITAPRSYIRPEMFDEGHGVLELRELRHPCLELQEDVIYVANDVIFCKGILHNMVLKYNLLMMLTWKFV